MLFEKMAELAAAVEPKFISQFFARHFRIAKQFFCFGQQMFIQNGFWRNAPMLRTDFPKVIS